MSDAIALRARLRGVVGRTRGWEYYLRRAGLRQEAGYDMAMTWL